MGSYFKNKTKQLGLSNRTLISLFYWALLLQPFFDWTFEHGSLGLFTLVCVYSLQVHDMANDVVFIWNAISSQHVSSLSGNIQSFATAIPLQHRDHLGYSSISARIRTLEEILEKTLKYIKKKGEITHFFWSISLPKVRQDCNPRVISVNMSAIFFCINWFLASGTPNWILIEGQNSINRNYFL